MRADFAADVAAGMNAGQLAAKYQSSRAAMGTRMRAVLGEKYRNDVARHANYAVKPERVTILAANAAPVREARTVYPSTRQPTIGAKRLLVDGKQNRKIGGQIQKGAWAGMPVFTLTLEERATCPKSCPMFRGCYGNAMHFAVRFRPDDAFEKRLALEVALLAMTHPKGFVVRLHVLGDFYSVDYVHLWRDLLAQFDNLRVYGYTARVPEDFGDPESRKIGFAIGATKDEFPDRFRIRWSRREPCADSTTVITYRPDQSRVPEGLVCAAERDLTACCSTCGMCWSEALKDETIVFILHGMQSGRRKAA